jgi:hypothetical protein
VGGEHPAVGARAEDAREDQESHSPAEISTGAAPPNTRSERSFAGSGLSIPPLSVDESRDVVLEKLDAGAVTYVRRAPTAGTSSTR